MNRHLAIHLVDSRQLMMLVRGRVPVADVHAEVRQALSRHASSSRVRFDTWQDAWNDLTGASPGSVGTLRLTPSRCLDCRGRRWMVDRRLGRVDACRACRGRGSGQPLLFTALHAAPRAEQGG